MCHQVQTGPEDIVETSAERPVRRRNRMPKGPSDPGNRLEPLDVEVRLLIEGLPITESERRELFTVIRERRHEINGLLRRAERAERRLRALALEDAIVELSTRGVRVKDTSEKLGCTPAFVSRTIERVRGRYSRLFAVEGGPTVAMKKQVQMFSQLNVIANGGDPFADVVGPRRESLISRLDSQDPNSEAQPEIGGVAEVIEARGDEPYMPSLADFDRLFEENPELFKDD